MRGRKPAPTHLKLVKGTKHRARINRHEAKIRPGLPMPPEFLSTPAKVEWGRICEDLYDAGILTKVDRGILAAYCQAFGRWQTAEETLAVHAARETAIVGERETTRGLLMKTISGNVIHNPLVGIANKAMADMAKYAAELGLTPSARSRVTAAPPKGDVDEAEKYLA